MELEDICGLFEISGVVADVQSVGSGRTNDTYKITVTDNGTSVHYILQRINKTVFGNIDALMSNISMVTEHTKREVIKEGGDPMRECLTLVYAKDGQKYKSKPSYITVDGEYYRMYNYIEGAYSAKKPSSLEEFAECAKVYAKSLKRLSVFPVDKLNTVVSNFHNTPRRINSLKLAAKNDNFGRAAGVKAEIEYVLEREKFAAQLTSLLAIRAVPMRVTHNDMRFSNTLFDVYTGEGLSLIDLDWIMSGSLLFDFGDAIRYGCNTAADNDTDLSKVHFSIDLYKAFTETFVEEMHLYLTAIERKFLPYSARLLAFESGVRYLTDYLNGDVYHKISYETENLHMARTQFLLADQIHEVMPELAGWTYNLVEV